MNKNYYEILGLKKSATKKEIKSAYRRLALIHHPDRNDNNSDSEDRFKEISEAYATLKDDVKKSKYDSSINLNNKKSSDFSFEDFFNGAGDVFSSRRSFYRFSGRSKINKNTIHLNIKFEESIFGTKKEVKIPRKTICNSCNGSRCESRYSLKECNVCSGRGTTRNDQNFASFIEQCSSCDGLGSVPKKPCLKCSGNGFLFLNKNIEIKIPAGIKNGNILRVRDSKKDLISNEKSDLLIKIIVKESNEFKRDGDNIYSNIEINFIKAILGGRVKVNTVHGEHYITIPECTKPGTIFRLKGKGVKSFDSNISGDHFINANIGIPDSITKKQKDILYQFSKE